MNEIMWITSGLFIFVYIIIITEKINQMTAGLLGAGILLFAKILSQEEAITYIDFNTLGLLIGMMMLVAVTKRSGLFQYLAIYSAKKAKGDPWRILIFMGLITAVASAFLDNVTTVLLVVPVTLTITESLEVNPLPFLYCEILASNIGGTATLIGDPPNVLIGSAAKLGFLDFLVNLGPLVVLAMVTTGIGFYIIYSKTFHVDPVIRERIMHFNEKRAITDHTLLKKSLILLSMTIAGFIVHKQLGLEAATVALSGAVVLLAISNVRVEAVLKDVEWETIFFFIGLFVLVGGLEKVGVIDLLAKKLVALTKGNVMLATFLILWGSGFASAFINNIPFVATMIPLVKAMGTLGGFDIQPLWWALAIGACFGGNGTLVGASANMVVAGIAAKDKKPISFISYFKIGFPVMIISLIISSLYLYIRYFI